MPDDANPSNAAKTPAAANSSNDPQQRRGAMAAIFLVAMMDFLGFGIIIPLLPSFIPGFSEQSLEHDTLGVLKVTLIFSIYSLCQFIGAPILGAISDRVGRRPVLVISQLGSSAGYLLLAVAPFCGAWTLIVVYLSRVIDGFTGGNIATAQAYISDVTTHENRAKGMGMLGAAFGIGFSLGPALGGILGYFGGMLGHHLGMPPDQLDVSLPAIAASALAAIAAVMSWTRLTDTRSHKPSEAEVWLHPSAFRPVLQNKIVMQMLMLSFCIMAAFVMMESTLVIYISSTKHFSFTKLSSGLFFAWLGFCIVVVQGGLVGRLSKRKGGEWPMAIFGPLFVAIGMALFTATAWYAWLWLLLAAGAINAVGRSLQQPAITALMSKYSDQKVQGTVFGVYHGLGSMARVIGPLIAAVTYTLLQNTGQFITAGAIALVVMVWTAMLRQRAGTPMMAVADAEAAAVEAT